MNELAKWALKAQSARHINAVEGLAKPWMTVSIQELDTHHFFLNMQNGTLHINKDDTTGQVTVELKPHNPADLITKVCPVDYDPSATCPIYDEAFAQVQPQKEVRDFLHRVVGYAATGDTSEQKLFFFYGGGRNGKSTFVDTWAYVLGNYATTIPIETFLSKGRNRDGGQATPHLARLLGVRFLRTSEAERSATLDESLIKLVTSGEPILVRDLHKGFFELIPQFKLIISGNYKPQIKGTDDGIWRRIVLIPWLVKVENVDPHLAKKLRAEGSGILNHIVAGIVAWMKGGLAPPQSILDATADYRDASDHLGRFLGECTAASPGSRVASQSLFQLHSAWAKATGAPVWGPTGFGRAMSDRGFRSMKSGSNFWLDLEVTKSLSDYQPSSRSHSYDPDEVEADDDIEIG